MKKTFSQFLTLILAFCMLSSCVPKDEFLPKSVQEMGSEGLNEQQRAQAEAEAEAEAAAEAAREAEQEETSVESEFVDSSSPTVDEIFENSLREVLYDEGGVDDEPMGTVDDWFDEILEGAYKNLVLSPSSFTTIYFYFKGMFKPGDEIRLYPDRDCTISSSRESWNLEGDGSELSFLVTSDLINAAPERADVAIPVFGAFEVSIPFSVESSNIDEGEFHPTVRYIREGVESKCYSFIGENYNLTKDTYDPGVPVLKVLNPYGLEGDDVRLEVLGDLSGVEKVNLYKTTDCTGDIQLSKNLSTSSVIRLNYTLTEEDRDGIVAPQTINLSFSAKFEDKAGNKGVVQILQVTKKLHPLGLLNSLFLNPQTVSQSLPLPITCTWVVHKQYRLKQLLCSKVIVSHFISEKGVKVTVMIPM